jgi:transposase
MAFARKYPLELRERAVRLVFESGRPVRQVARDLGIHHESLRVWVRQAEADTGRRRELLTTDERDELKRLRKENAELGFPDANLGGGLLPCHPWPSSFAACFCFRVRSCRRRRS